MRFHKIANVNKALDFIASKGVKLVSIGAEGMWKDLPTGLGCQVLHFSNKFDTGTWDQVVLVLL